MSSLSEQIRNAPRRRVPNLPAWWGFAGGIALITLLLVVAVTAAGGDTAPSVSVPAVPVDQPDAGYVVAPDPEGVLVGLPPQAITLGQSVVRGLLTGEWGATQVVEGYELPRPWLVGDANLTISNPVEVAVIEFGVSYRIAFEVDPDGLTGELVPDIVEVTVMYLPQGWRWLPDRAPEGQ